LRKFILFILVISAVSACQKKKTAEYTPWGEALSDSIREEEKGEGFSLSDIQANGELIILTMNGPDTYYEYRGRGFGTQYLLCEKFAERIGVKVRVDVCKDTMEMVDKLISGDADVIAFPLNKTKTKSKQVAFCGPKVDSVGVQWAVKKGNTSLADTLNRWFKPEMIAQVKKEEDFMLSTKSVTRKIYSPMLNKAGGIISHYDEYFVKAAAVVRWDWRLIAAQCYQESCFDPQAKSWAGACGLMQIMPSTADRIGLRREDLFSAEKNIAAAAKYLSMLQGQFKDVRDTRERTNFVLASYNAGPNHIRDAMALTEKYGGNKYRWSDVKQYVLNLMKPEFYNDPVVKYGYMRGTETAGYVDNIYARWQGYKGTARARSISAPSFNGGTTDFRTPHKAKKKNRFSL